LSCISPIAVLKVAVSSCTYWDVLGKVLGDPTREVKENPEELDEVFEATLWGMSGGVREASRVRWREVLREARSEV
jgi:hypothetical protein